MDKELINNYFQCLIVKLRRAFIIYSKCINIFVVAHIHSLTTFQGCFRVRTREKQIDKLQIGPSLAQDFYKFSFFIQKMYLKNGLRLLIRVTVKHFLA